MNCINKVHPIASVWMVKVTFDSSAHQEKLLNKWRSDTIFLRTLLPIPRTLLARSGETVSAKHPVSSHTDKYIAGPLSAVFKQPNIDEVAVEDVR